MNTRGILTVSTEEHGLSDVELVRLAVEGGYSKAEVMEAQEFIAVPEEERDFLSLSDIIFDLYIWLEQPLDHVIEKMRFERKYQHHCPSCSHLICVCDTYSTM